VQLTGLIKLSGKKGVILSLYANINAKKKRIKAGSKEVMKPKGAKGRPKASDFANAAKTAKKKVKK